MKTRRGAYGDADIDTPPLDSHFRTRSTTPRALSPVDGVYDASLLPTAGHESDAGGQRTISGSDAQTDVVGNAATTQNIDQRSVVQDEAVNRLATDHVEAEPVQEPTIVNPSDATSGGNGQESNLAGTSVKGETRETSTAKKTDKGSDDIRVSKSSSINKERKPRRSRDDYSGSRGRSRKRKSSSRRSRKHRRRRRSPSTSSSSSSSRSSDSYSSYSRYSRRRSRSRSRERSRSRKYDDYDRRRSSYDGYNIRHHHPPVPDTVWPPVPAPAPAPHYTNPPVADTSEADAAHALKKQRYRDFKKFAINLYTRYFTLDEDSQRWKDYDDALHILFAKYNHDQKALEFEAQMYVLSIRELKINTSSTHNSNQHQAADGGGDGGDDGGSVGETNPVQDSSDDDDGADMEREGFYTAASWNPPAPYQRVPFSKEIAAIRRALYLCDIPDAFHTILITVGGIKTIQEFSVMSTAKWEVTAKLMAKQKTLEGSNLIINTNNQRLLVALSLWARVKIVLGKTFRDFDKMTKAELESIAKREVCEGQHDDTAELEPLTDTKQYLSWRIKFHRYCRHRYNSEGVPYTYVIRDKEPPPKFNTLMEELIYLLPLDMGDAQFRSDSNLVFSYLEQAIRAETAKPLVQNKTKQSEQNGRKIFLQLNARFEGEGAKPLNVQDAETELGRLSWNNNPSFPPEKFTSLLTKYFNVIDENDGEPWKDDKKIRVMVRAICRNNPDMIKSNPWIYHVRDTLQDNWSTWDFAKAVDFFHSKARQNIPKKRSVSSVNGKKGRGNKSKKSRSDTASSDSNSSNISAHSQKLRGYKVTGEPTKDVIEGINISPITQRKSRLSDDQMSRLPHVVRAYLEEHYLSKMPPPKSKSASKRSKAYSKLKNKRNKATKRQVKSILSSVMSELDQDEDSSDEGDDSGPTSVSTNTTGGRS